MSNWNESDFTTSLADDALADRALSEDEEAWLDYLNLDDQHGMATQVEAEADLIEDASLRDLWLYAGASQSSFQPGPEASNATNRQDPGPPRSVGLRARLP